MTLLGELDTPVLVVDEGLMDENIRRMTDALSATAARLRPHFKTSKMVEVARRQLAAGAIGMTCATPGELVALLNAGIADVFWAHAPATGVKARLAAEANRRGTVIVGLDSIELAHRLSAAATAAEVVVPVRVEVDTGLRRTGVRPDEANGLARGIVALPGLALEGVYMHEGQLASMKGSRADLVAAGHAAAQQLVDVAEAIRATGIPVTSVSVGSTPGWDSAPFVPGVTECRAGTYVFADANQWRLGSTRLEDCALHLIATVVRGPRDGEVVIDAGIKALSSDGSNRDATFGIVVDSEGRPADIVFDRAYEEHGVLRGPGTASLQVGDRVRIVPNHACGAVNMWSRIVVAASGRVLQAWHPVGRF